MSQANPPSSLTLPPSYLSSLAEHRRDAERELEEKIAHTKQLIQQVEGQPFTPPHPPLRFSQSCHSHSSDPSSPVYPSPLYSPFVLSIAAPTSSSISSRLTPSDYFARSAEFRLWLHNTHQLHLDSISTERAHILFDSFIDAWNRRTLPPSYYLGVDSSALPPSTLTSHRWRFVERMADEEKMAIASTRDAVDTSTHHHTYQQEFAAAAAEERGGKGVGKVGEGGAGGVGSERRGGGGEGGRGGGGGGERREGGGQGDRRWKERVKEGLEELAPRETGRERVLERRRERGEYARRERDEGMEELDEAEVMEVGGGGVGGREGGELERLKERERRREERREGDGRAKRAEYEAREKQRMRAMLESIGMADKYPIQ